MCRGGDPQILSLYIVHTEGWGTPHITIEVIWSDVQTRVGTPHKIEFFLEKGGRGAQHIHFDVMW